MAVEYGVDVEDTDTSLPTSLPESYSDPVLRPSLAPAGRELEEYRVRSAAQQMGMDPDIAAGVAFQESRFNPKAKSSTGVRGTMQVTRSTAKGLGYNRDIPDENIRAGIALLKKGMDKHPNDLNKALKIYPAPKDRKHWIPSVLSHSMRSKENRRKTTEDITANIPDDLFTVPDQPLQNTPPEATGASPLNVEPQGDPGTIDKILSYLKTKPTDESGNPIMTKGVMGMPLERPAPGKTFGSAATVASMGLGGAAIKGGIGLASKVPGVANVLAKGGKAATAIKTAVTSLFGAGSGAGIATVEGRPEDAATAAIIGGSLPIVMSSLGAVVKGFANKMGDTSIGKKGIGKWINNTFGKTKSLDSLSKKNDKVYQQVEKRLQTTLEKYDNSLGQLKIDKAKLATRVVGKGKVEENILHRAAKDVLENEGSQEVADTLVYLGDKVNRGDPFTRIELNQMKRAIYKYGNSWTKAGAVKSTEFSKNTAKVAKYLKKTVEDNTDDTVRALNQEEAQHMALRDAVNKKIGKKPSAWSTMTKVVPAITAGGAASAAGGPVAGGLATAATLAGQTVPGFTAAGAAGQAAQNPELQRILSVLLPQFLQGE